MKNKHQIDIPLIFFSCAFFIIILALFSRFSFQYKPSVENRQMQTPLQQVSKKTATIAINYNKPILCDYQTKDSSISAAIDMNAITVSLKGNKSIQKYTIQGDCLYSWIYHEFVGQKKCGIGSTIALGRQLLSSGLGTLDSFAGMIPKQKGMMNVDFQAVFKSCKNVREIDTKIFVVPKSVLFK